MGNIFVNWFYYIDLKLFGKECCTNPYYPTLFIYFSLFMGHQAAWKCGFAANTWQEMLLAGMPEQIGAILLVNLFAFISTLVFSRSIWNGLLRCLALISAQEAFYSFGCFFPRISLALLAMMGFAYLWWGVASLISYLRRRTLVQ